MIFWLSRILASSQSCTELGKLVLLKMCQIDCCKRELAVALMSTAELLASRNCCFCVGSNCLLWSHCGYFRGDVFW